MYILLNCIDGEWVQEVMIENEALFLFRLAFAVPLIGWWYTDPVLMITAPPIKSQTKRQSVDISGRHLEEN